MKAFMNKYICYYVLTFLNNRFVELTVSQLKLMLKPLTLS